ncbi:MAG: type II toxin-antitoxin system VapC family toxin [Acidimicrobiia bacterium]|nr:type II toxin-antitoxin system VapC family toxin [bacterium]MXW57783.1 type II toxin-antitoxin system VapC family toxin [Acidimicrobiia bacterium]MXZ84563.1 type II toxin-antitoxin system VapC family toxin [Acidimicrobiia bacterium]MYB09610.1 type II toxin-antitoxin system VapC family toxin [Acidimicrobiia bacterium]MYB75199.1 type II toxin-antitoxin system VapC family toxin [Acidimicrobiia bacterium]
MRILLDSHVALWWLDDHVSLGVECRRQIEQADEAFFSVVTPWELGIKRALGKLTMPYGLVDALRSGGFIPLYISVEHAERAPALPNHHRDPFDRMLVAQAQLEALSLATADEAFNAYDVELIDARN